MDRDTVVFPGTLTCWVYQSSYVWSRDLEKDGPAGEKKWKGTVIL